MPLSQPTTIKSKIIRFYVFVSIAVCLLIVAYSFQIISLGKEVTTLDEFHDIFSNVLEIRRYEKNFQMKVGSDNLKNIILYLDKIDRDVTRLDSDISSIAGSKAKADFHKKLKKYKTILGSLNNKQNIPPEEISSNDRMLVDFAEDLLLLKQNKIQRVLKWTMYSYIVITGVFLLFVILFFNRQLMSILKRTSFLQQATKDLLDDNSSSIEIESNDQDEITDLTKTFNKMALELGTKQEQLVQSGKLAAIGTFSSGIAHELNNPLNNISLSADTLLEEYGKLDDDEEKEILTDIIIQTDRASEIVKNLLDFCRVNEPLMVNLDIKEVITATLQLIANQLYINSIWVEDYVPEGLPPINGDFQKLQQVFLNLFLNAIHVMPEGGMIYLEAYSEQDYVHIKIGDTGTGIDSANIDHIFDPFYTTKEVGNSTGLGLSIVYQILKKHAGYIEVKSKVNVGTTFSVYLPIAEETIPESPA